MRVVLVAATLVALVGAPALAAVPPYDLAKIHPTEAAFNGSIKVYQDALAANPQDADAAYWLGHAYWNASYLYRNGEVAYGADYLDKSIDALERAVHIDDKYLAAWQVLAVAYFTRGHFYEPTASGQHVPSDDERSLAAEEKVLELGKDLRVARAGVPPRSGVRSGEVTFKYLPLPDRSVKFNPADYIVVGDPDTKLLYRFPCATLPAIKRPMLFLTKWEAINRGYTPATVCPPP
jgi:tetratricopeptide (TPR) repeat protein